MKITRLRKGYRINLSDSEFEALCLLVQHGESDIDGVSRAIDLGFVSPAAKRALDKIRMSVDDDRRGAKD